MDEQSKNMERSVRFVLTEEQYRNLLIIQEEQMRRTVSDTLRFLIDKAIREANAQRVEA